MDRASFHLGSDARELRGRLTLGGVRDLSLRGDVDPRFASEVEQLLVRTPFVRLSFYSMERAPCKRLAGPCVLSLCQIRVFDASLIENVTALDVMWQSVVCGGWTEALSGARRLERLMMYVSDNRTLNEICAATFTCLRILDVQLCYKSVNLHALLKLLHTFPSNGEVRLGFSGAYGGGDYATVACEPVVSFRRADAPATLVLYSRVWVVVTERSAGLFESLGHVALRVEHDDVFVLPETFPDAFASRFFSHPPASFVVDTRLHKDASLWRHFGRLVAADFPVEVDDVHGLGAALAGRRALLALLYAGAGPAGRFVDRDGGFGAHAAGPLTRRMAEFLM